jgi:DNA polymerase III delta subunit
MIYFVHGPDRFLAREAATGLVMKVDPSRTNTSWLDGRETSLDRLVAEIGTVSFFGDPRVVVVTDFVARSERSSNATTGNTRKKPQPAKKSDLEILLQSAPHEHILVLLEPTLAGLPAALKPFADGITVVSGDAPRGDALISWIMVTAQELDSAIEKRGAVRLAQSLFPQSWQRKSTNPRFDVPPDMSLLRQELEKLALAAHPGQIEEALIEASVPQGAQHRLFGFIDAAIVGNVPQATNELDRLLAAGEDPSMILAQVLGQVELLTIAKAAGGRHAERIASDLGSVSASRMSAVQSASHHVANPADVLEIALGIDRRLKTGRVRQPQEALHLLVAELAACRPNETGHSR